MRKLFFSSDKKNIPGPFNYNTAGDIRWKNKKISLKSREKSYFDREGKWFSVDITVY